MSLRNRIAFYYTIATAFLIALVFTVIYFMVDNVVYRQFDEEIRKEISEIFTDSHINRNDFKGFSSFSEFDADHKSNDDEHENNKHDVDAEFIQIVNSAGTIIKKSENLSRNLLIFNPDISQIAYFNSTVGNSTVRQVQVPLVNRQGKTEGYLIIALPLKNAIIVLHDLQYVFFFSFPAIIITLFILTRLIAGKSIRPIEKVIATAEKMTQTNLNERIALPSNHDEIYRLSATINALLDRMQEAFQREKQFTSDASHELKTPLAAVKGTLEVLVRKPREREHYETRVQFCLTELNRMARLIDQLLILARYESNKMSTHIETVELCGHIEDAVARVLPSAHEKNISVSLDHREQSLVAADAAMLEMIFENILSNAIKYSPSNSSIIIAIERKASSTLCTITDQGIGIPEEKIHAVFERFYRVDESRNSSTGGFGLGLSIVKKLADLQKIKVAVKRGTTAGTTFELTFPST
ncbi:MAG: HAMP domain-containing protein [Chlorobium sp.]|nr:MAG: HAMP domain-containing protein [Chlorobium sp.]